MDADTARICGADTTRRPIHFVRSGSSLPESIHYLPNFRPVLLQPPHINQDDLDAIFDAVCSKSFALEDADTKALRAPRTSDGPEVESLAALPQ